MEHIGNQGIVHTIHVPTPGMYTCRCNANKVPIPGEYVRDLCHLRWDGDLHVEARRTGSCQIPVPVPRHFCPRPTQPLDPGWDVAGSGHVSSTAIPPPTCPFSYLVHGVPASCTSDVPLFGRGQALTCNCHPGGAQPG